MGQGQIELLTKTRQQLVADRRACVEMLATGSDNLNIEMVAEFKLLQEAIIAVDQAIIDEERLEKARRAEEAIEELGRRSKLVRP
jgi:hypothetical protein